MAAMADNFDDPSRYETVPVESEVREGYFHRVVRDISTGKAVSCSCKCWSKGGKACAAMRGMGT